MIFHILECSTSNDCSSDTKHYLKSSFCSLHQAIAYPIQNTTKNLAFVVSIKQLLTCCSWDWQESWGNLQALRWFPQCGLHEVRAPHDSWSWQSSSLWYSTRQQPRIWTNCLNDYWLIDQILTDFECQSGLLVSLVMRMLIQWAYRESSLSVNQIVISSHVSNHLTVFSLASISFSFTAEMAMSWGWKDRTV